MGGDQAGALSGGGGTAKGVGMCAQWVEGGVPTPALLAPAAAGNACATSSDGIAGSNKRAYNACVCSPHNHGAPAGGSAGGSNNPAGAASSACADGRRSLGGLDSRGHPGSHHGARAHSDSGSHVWRNVCSGLRSAHPRGNRRSLQRDPPQCGGCNLPGQPPPARTPAAPCCPNLRCSSVSPLLSIIYRLTTRELTVQTSDGTACLNRNHVSARRDGGLHHPDEQQRGVERQPQPTPCQAPSNSSGCSKNGGCAFPPPATPARPGGQHCGRHR